MKDLVRQEMLLRWFGAVGLTGCAVAFIVRAWAITDWTSSLPALVALAMVVALATRASLKAGPDGLEISMPPGERAVAILKNAARDKKLAPSLAARELSAETKLDAMVLWVDDKPDNNAFEQMALAALGFRIVSVCSTKRALVCLEEESFDLVISDMKRPDGLEAGTELVRKIRAVAPWHDLPILIYMRSADDPRKNGALAAGALCVESTPSDLARAAIDAVRARGTARTARGTA